MSEASIDAVTPAIQNRIIEQIVRDEDDEIPLIDGSPALHCLHENTLTFSLDEPDGIADAPDDRAIWMLAEVDRRFTSTYSDERDGYGWRLFDVKGKHYRIDVSFVTMNAAVELITKHGDHDFTGTNRFIHFLDLLDARQTQADRDRVPYVPQIVEERVVHPAQARVESMQAYVEDTFPFEFEWAGQRHWQEDAYYDGVMTSYRMVTLPIFGDTLFKFVEDGASSCCKVSLNEPVIIYTMEQLTDIIAAVTDPSYVARQAEGGRIGIPDAMLIGYQPQPADKCMVCLVEAAEEGGDNDGWVSLSLCSHRFHRVCICRWPCTTCPLCRTNHAT